MADRIEITGNIVVHHPERGVYRIANTPAVPFTPGPPTSYVIKEIDVVTGLQQCKVYSHPDMQLLSKWLKEQDGPWVQVVTAEGLLNSQATP